jgi:hypothetical protein
MRSIYCLIKIYREEEYAKAFLNTGEMYCQTLKKFKEINDDNNRCDRFEGTSHWFQAKDVKMSFTVRNKNDDVLSTIDIEESDLAGPTVLQPAGFDGFNLFSMYAMVIEDFEESYSTEDEKKLRKEKINRSIAEQIKMDPLCQKLGDHAVVIYKVEKFIETVVSHAKNNNMKIGYKLVEYFDPDKFTGSFNGAEAIFRKQKTYKYQNEFRFAVQTNNKTQEPIKIRVGPLNDSAFIVPSKDLNAIAISIL